MRWLLFNPRYTDSPEKDKRKSLPVRAGWMHSRYYAYVVCALFFITGLLNIFEPPIIGGTKSMMMMVMGISCLVLGVPVAIVFAVLNVFIADSFVMPGGLDLIPTVPEQLKSLVMLAALTIILALLIRRLQRFSRTFKRAVYLNYVPHFLLLIFFLSSPPGKLSSNYTANTTICHYKLSSDTSIRVVAEYRYYSPIKEDDWGQKSYFNHYQVTHDGGQTWYEFMLGADSDVCNTYGTIINARSLDDNFFWYWEGHSLVTTRDGGVTWTLWQGYHCNYIELVEFSGIEQGQIISENCKRLYTDNGGVNWQEQN